MARRKSLFNRLGYLTFIFSAAALLVFGAVSLIYVLVLNDEVVERFEGNRWQVPSRVYARALEIYENKPVSQADVRKELELLRYKPAGIVNVPGQYKVEQNILEVFIRDFDFWDGHEQSRHVLIKFSGDRITRIEDLTTGKPVGLLRMEPVFIGGIYPRKREDRILVRLDQVPALLVDTLLAVEDREFYHHDGVSPKSILRALLVNMSAGARVQGGSTITQQLVKNFYLSNEKSYLRKINEAIMAVLLEYHYSKSDILEAYLNEVYLGQEGSRAIHGIGLASWFYFEKRPEELTPPEIALLIGLVKGPSYYDPRRFPDRALERRNVALKVMSEQGLLNSSLARALQSDLGVIPDKPQGITPYPAFVDLVKRQLVEDYPEALLKTGGLRLFTTLDPIAQAALESVTQRQLPDLEKKGGIPKGKLQIASMISDRATGEVVALLGGRNADYEGFNRALDAYRPVGSLVKPAVYLAALDRPGRYHLASMLDDSELVVDGKWEPRNYDGLFHGQVPLFEALAQSYNVATVRLGLDIGLDKVVETLHSLGIDRDIPPYPAIMLGALDLSPRQVLQMYQTLSGGGFQVPLRAIRAITTGDGLPLNRYALEIRRVASPEGIYLVNVALQNAVRTGTGRGIYNYLPKSLTIAGKTGTTDDNRDSWFAGYAEDYVGVVWLGRDDNQSIHLTGSSGALHVWGEVMSKLRPQSLNLVPPANMEFVTVDARNGFRTHDSCGVAIEIPVVRGYAPVQQQNCDKKAQNLLERTLYWFKDMF